MQVLLYNNKVFNIPPNITTQMLYRHRNLETYKNLYSYRYTNNKCYTNVI